MCYMMDLRSAKFIAAEYLISLDISLLRAVPDFLGARCEIRNEGPIQTQYI
jgi:protein-tyrosine phosphatase